MAEYRFEEKGISVTYVPETVQLAVNIAGQKRVWQGESSIRDKAGNVYFLKDARCVSSEYKSDTSVGARAAYTFDALDATLHTLVELLYSGEMRISFWFENEPADGIREVKYPPAFSFGAQAGQGYTALPRMQGILIPAKYEKELSGGTHEGTVLERDAYMPMFGQTICGVGYTAIFDTPYDARYILEHPAGGDTLISPVFIASLGKMRYKRVMLYHFSDACDYNLMAKTYRRYLKQRGKLVTLEMKAAANPNIRKLFGTPIVHTGIAKHISPKSDYYKPGDPEHNDSCVPFETRANQLRALKKLGVEKAYLHLDGWGCHGYDNMHPHPFPVNEAAGGSEGMKALSDTCASLGYTFGIHDQYRDYYYDAPGFDIDKAVTNEDGSHPYCSVWYGGPHSFLCAKNAPDFVRRNYDAFENLGIRIEGAYLDVFSVVELDQCFSKEHPMTREECRNARAECFHILMEKGIIPSSEETLDALLPDIALCHHAPFFTENLGKPSELFGIPIPLLNLVWHDCVVIPWSAFGETGGWGLPLGYSGYGLALINGGTVYLSAGENGEHLPMINAALSVHAGVATSELLRHELVNGDPMHQISHFADGTVCDVDFRNEIYLVNGKKIN